ncbi:MAG TPA: cytochrome C [Chloroflexi bacterium]|nr:cytochrome C [Chloroflexota bacterium]
MRLRWQFTIPLLLIVTALAGIQIASAREGGIGESLESLLGKTSFDERCLRCHAGSDATVRFENGEERSVNFDLDAFNASVHGASNPEGYLSCYDCHGDYRFPHEGGPYETPRDLRLELSARCEGCHSYQAELRSESVHTVALEEGNPDAPVCVDCHGYHDVSQPGVPRAAISLTCGNCHSEILEQYRESVHGAALLEESNPDVPTCIDCHGVHRISDPTTNLFRVRSPELCAKCHANKELMSRYGISTEVFDTYVADFHGSTVILFEHEDPNAEVNKAVCYDCHGVHDIRPPDDPNSSVLQENLLETCQRCHPDADANFPAAWMSHYEPSPDKYPLVYYVDLFYKIFIPLVLGFFVFVIATDIIRRLRDRLNVQSES